MPDRASKSCTFPCCTCIDSADKGVVQKFGKFDKILAPGCTMVCWPMATVAGVSMKTRKTEVTTRTKTKDNVTVTIKTALMWGVGPDDSDLENYYFKLLNPEDQISAYVDDCIRSHIPTMTLDDAFEAKESIANAVKEQVSVSMKAFGVQVVRALMTDMEPDAEVAKSMNSINAAIRDRAAASERAEADKIIAVKAAEAEAEAKHLSGMGTAKMRHAITEGFRGSIDSMQASCGMSPQEVVHMMLVTQYLDVLKEFATSGKATMVIPHAPSSVSDIENQVRNGFMQASMAGAE